MIILNLFCDDETHVIFLQSYLIFLKILFCHYVVSTTFFCFVFANLYKGDNNKLVYSLCVGRKIELKELYDLYEGPSLYYSIRFSHVLNFKWR